jgi:hypothetical protein
MLRKSRITVSVGTVGAVVTINRKIVLVPQNLIDLSSQAEEEKTPPPSPSTHQNMSLSEAAKRTGSTTSNRRKRSASSKSLQPAVKRPRTTKNTLPASAVHTFNSQFMKRRGQTQQTPHNSNHGHRNSGPTSSRQSARQSFGGIETLFATKVSRKAATSIKKTVKQRFSHSSIMKRMPNQQHHQQPPVFESSRKTIAARNNTSSVNYRRRNLHHSQRSATPLDVDDVAAHFAKYTSSKKSTRKNSNHHRRSSSSAKGNSNHHICHPQHQRHQTNETNQQDEDEQDDDTNPHRHQHANDSDDDVGVPSSQPELNVSGEEEDDAIDALPNDADADEQEKYVYQPPESALFSSKKKKHASSSLYPMSPSATPRHPDASSSSSSSFNGSSITTSSNNIGFNPPLAAAPFPSSSSSSSSSSSFSSSSSSLSRSSSGGSSWHSIVDKSVALSAAGGGKVHRMLAQSPSSALKTSSSKWSGRGSSGRGGGKRGGSSNKRGSSWLDRNRNRLRAGKCGELAQQLLDMQEDVSRKVEQLKGLEFQQHNVATTGTSTKNKRRFVSRSDPRSGIFVELQVLHVNASTRSGQLVAQCKRTKRIVGGGRKQHQHQRPDHTQEQQQANVELVVNEKRAKEIAIQPGCTLRIFEPWLDVFSSARKHMQSMNSTQSLPDLLVASNLIVKS